MLSLVGLPSLPFLGLGRPADILAQVGGSAIGQFCPRNACRRETHKKALNGCLVRRHSKE
jgi:hypothetical protein